MSGGMMLGGGLMMLIWLLLGLLIIVGLWFLIKSLATGARAPHTEARGEVGGPTPAEILKTRYARGEISREEYEEAQRTLNLDR